MIGALLALQIATAAPSPSVIYEDVPVQVVRLELFEWNGDGPGARQTVVPGARRIALHGHARRQYVALFLRQDDGYLVDGPFVWPDRDALRAVERRWHRTIGGSLPPGASIGGVEWIPAGAVAGPWPRCFEDGSSKWFCWGVAIDSHGAVVLRAGGSIWWATSRHSHVSRARWGRLVIVSGRSPGSTAKGQFGYPVAPPPGRLRGLRFETGVVAEATATAIAPDAIWIAGESVPPDAWLEVTTERGGPVYLSLHDLASGPSSLPVHVVVSDRRTLEGRAVSADGQAARGTLISVFRLIDPLRADASRDPPRRVLAEEVIADAEGRFQLDALGEAEYEIVAWHSQLGRASVIVPSGAGDLVIQLRSSGIARGRVLAGGRPVAGVNVTSVPDAAIFTAASDMTDVKGGDAQTDQNGRFSVTVAASGGGELRIGGGRYAVKRVPLPRPPVPLFDVGDVILGDSIPVIVVLDQDPGCDVRAAGPVGRTGLQVVPGKRNGDHHDLVIPEPGLWEFTLVCRGERRSLVPGAVQIGAAHAGKEVRLIVR
jgi:hypothetical protein